MFICFVIGAILGLCAMGACWSSSERKAIRRGFVELDGNLYRLTHIGLCDLKEDEE